MGKLLFRLALVAVALFAAVALYASFAELPSPMRVVEVDIPGAQLK